MMTSTLRKANWVLSQQIGIDLRKALYSPCGFARYFFDLIKFRRAFSGKLHLLPCIHDRKETAGEIASEYFWQDLLVAQLVCRANPDRHVDVGSRIDGFVAHVAAFREIEVFDVRPLGASIPGVVFRQADLMSMDPSLAGMTDSLSCLHALEHFGLGRYGDPINTQGFDLGLASLSNLLTVGGVLYLSCPCGEDVVYFNAHRSLSPETVVRAAASKNLQAESIWLFDQNARGFRDPIQPTQLAGLDVQDNLTLALYKFTKLAA